MAFVIRSTTADDWRELRALRLEMLADTPLAFGERLEDAAALDERQWRVRGARPTNPRTTVLAAIADDGTWLGTMGGVVEFGRPVLVGVYVTPSARGAESGVADALLAGVEQWARTEGSEIILHVHSQNPRARAFYARRGYVESGVTLPYRLDTSQTELEMVKTLR